MKRILIAASLVALSAASAGATTNSEQLLSNHQSEITRLVPGADLSNLSGVQLTAIADLFSKADNLRSGEDASGRLKVILGWN